MEAEPTESHLGWLFGICAEGEKETTEGSWCSLQFCILPLFLLPKQHWASWEPSPQAVGKKQIKLNLHSPYPVIAACVPWAAKDASLPSQAQLFSHQPRTLMGHRHVPSFRGLERGGKPGRLDMGRHVWPGSPCLPSHQLHQPSAFLFHCPTNPMAS